MAIVDVHETYIYIYIYIHKLYSHIHLYIGSLRCRYIYVLISIFFITLFFLAFRLPTIHKLGTRLGRACRCNAAHRE